VCIDYTGADACTWFPANMLTLLGFNALEFKVQTMRFVSTTGGEAFLSPHDDDNLTQELLSYCRRAENVDVEALRLLVGDFARIDSPSKIVHAPLSESADTSPRPRRSISRVYGG
jgi:hypothetical protein